MRTTLFLLVFVSNFACCFAQPNVLREKLSDIYLSQVGIKEATGANDGLEVERYLSNVGLSKGQPWCAAFVSWCLSEAGINNPKSGWSPAYFTNKTTIYIRGGNSNNRPQMGDVIGIYFNSLERIAHVGFVHTWGASWVVSVEGNTNDDGSREGDRVAIKRRPVKTIYKVSSFIR